MKVGDFNGTLEYVSRRVFQGYPPERRDDVESLLLVLISLTGALPWSGIRRGNAMTDARLKTTHEEAIPIELLLKTLASIAHNRIHKSRCASRHNLSWVRQCAFSTRATWKRPPATRASAMSSRKIPDKRDPGASEGESGTCRGQSFLEFHFLFAHICSNPSGSRTSFLSPVDRKEAGPNTKSAPSRIMASIKSFFMGEDRKTRQRRTMK